MAKYNDNLEKTLTAIFGALGTVAVIVNLFFVKGFTLENLLDALKDLAGLVVVITVFLIASKMFNSMSYGDFKKLFEKKLKEWINQNKFLIDDELAVEGKDGKQFYWILTKEHHKNVVFQEQTANKFDRKGSASQYHKAAFLYTDIKNKEELIIGLSKSMFLGNEYQDNLGLIAGKLKERIIDFSEGFEFTKKSQKNRFEDIDIKVFQDNTRLLISIKDVDKTEENAQKLIDMLEYVKTMILALA